MKEEWGFDGQMEEKWVFHGNWELDEFERFWILFKVGISENTIYVMNLIKF